MKSTNETTKQEKISCGISGRVSSCFGSRVGIGSLVGIMAATLAGVGVGDDLVAVGWVSAVGSLVASVDLGVLLCVTWVAGARTVAEAVAVGETTITGVRVAVALTAVGDGAGYSPE